MEGLFVRHLYFDGESHFAGCLRRYLRQSEIQCCRCHRPSRQVIIDRAPWLVLYDHLLVISKIEWKNISHYLKLVIERGPGFKPK